MKVILVEVRGQDLAVVEYSSQTLLPDVWASILTRCTLHPIKVRCDYTPPLPHGTSKLTSHPALPLVHLEKTPFSRVGFDPTALVLPLPWPCLMPRCRSLHIPRRRPIWLTCVSLHGTRNLWTESAQPQTLRCFVFRASSADGLTMPRVGPISSLTLMSSCVTDYGGPCLQIPRVRR